MPGDLNAAEERSSQRTIRTKLPGVMKVEDIIKWLEI